jgi:hypothetical protein
MSISADHLDLEALKLAFLQDMLGRIARADTVVVAAEEALIDVVCPPEALRQAGLADADGRPTPLAEAASVRALLVLPGALPEDQRLKLVTPLAKLAEVDGEVDMREKSTIAMAGHLLGLSIPALVAHLEGTGVKIVMR